MTDPNDEQATTVTEDAETTPSDDVEATAPDDVVTTPSGDVETTVQMSTSTDLAVIPKDETSVDRRARRRWWQLPRSLVLAYTVLFVAIEAIGAFIDINVQVGLEAAAALLAVNHAVFGYRTQRTAGLVMTALFTSRLATITLPLDDASLTTRAGVIGAMTIFIVMLTTWVLRTDVSTGRTNEGFPLKRPLLTPSFTAAVTVLAGFPLGWAGSQLLAPHALAIQPIHGYQGIPWAIAVGCLLVSATGEELLYRRLVAAMVQHTGQSQTPIISALLFGATFFGTHNAGFIALAAAAGGFFAWSCERTGSIRPAIASHFIISVLVFVVLPA
jgi:membrane protease YdiL (CAAX protease family)